MRSGLNTLFLFVGEDPCEALKLMVSLVVQLKRFTSCTVSFSSPDSVGRIVRPSGVTV